MTITPEAALQDAPKKSTYQTVSLDDLGLDLSRLAMKDEDVARMTKSYREERVRELVKESHQILEMSIERLVTGAGRGYELAGIVTLISGGNDSTTLAHVFKGRATHHGHANTGIGVEKTRQYVRDVSAEWGIPLMERRSPRREDSYEYRVLTWGFPGPGSHGIVYSKIKERALEMIRSELVPRPTRQRVVFLAGRRRSESDRRANVPELQRKGSTVYSSPMVNWTKPDMVTYRLMCAAGLLPGGEVPRNEVSDLIHMSGECLCGCFAHLGEREEISGWFPEAYDDVARWEAELATYAPDFIPPEQFRWYDYARARPGAYEDEHGVWRTKKGRPIPVPAPIPEYAKKHGWGADPATLALSREKPGKGGVLCSSCDARHDAALQAKTVIVA